MLLLAIKSRARRYLHGPGAVTLGQVGRVVDAFLVSYPKSGRTWLRFLLASYMSELAAEPAAVDLHSMFGIVPNFDLTPKRGIPAFVGRTPERPLVCCTHRPYEAALFPSRPTVLLLRDARDVLASAYFHHTRHTRRFAGGRSAFLLDPRLGVAPLAAFLNAWAEALPTRPHLVVSYEAMSRDAGAVLEAVARFLRIPVVPAAIATAVERSSFAAMREQELAGGIPDHTYDRADPNSLRMRQGIVGGHATVFSDRELEALLRGLEDRLREPARILARTIDGS